MEIATCYAALPVIDAEVDATDSRTKTKFQGFSKEGQGNGRYSEGIHIHIIWV